MIFGELLLKTLVRKFFLLGFLSFQVFPPKLFLRNFPTKLLSVFSYGQDRFIDWEHELHASKRTTSVSQERCVRPFTGSKQYRFQGISIFFVHFTLHTNL